MEHELSTLLRDNAERVRVDRSRREDTLKRARRGRGLAMATVLFGVASVVVISVSMAGSLREETPPTVPVDRPTEHRDLGEEDMTADILIAEAPDGSWSMFAGVSEDGELLCLSLEGMGCVAASFRDSFVLLQSFAGHPEQEGFIYGPAKAVAALELVTDNEVIPLRLRDFPDRLGLDHLRFFVRAVAGEGNGVIVARDEAGRVLQQMDVTWGRDGAKLPECAGDGERKDATPPADPAKVAVYFSCIHDIGTVGEPLYMHERAIGGGNRDVAEKLTAALSEYLKGPTHQETERGYTSALSKSFEGTLESASVDGQTATLSFSPQLEDAAPFASTAGRVLRAELAAITFQFDQIDELVLEISGDCDRFWRMLESDCNVLKR